MHIFNPIQPLRLSSPYTPNRLQLPSGLILVRDPEQLLVELDMPTERAGYWFDIAESHQLTWWECDKGLVVSAGPEFGIIDASGAISGTFTNALWAAKVAKCLEDLC